MTPSGVPLTMTRGQRSSSPRRSSLRNEQSVSWARSAALVTQGMGCPKSGSGKPSSARLGLTWPESPRAGRHQRTRCAVGSAAGLLDRREGPSLDLRARLGMIVDHADRRGPREAREPPDLPQRQPLHGPRPTDVCRPRGLGSSLPSMGALPVRLRHEHDQPGGCCQRSMLTGPTRCEWRTPIRRPTDDPRPGRFVVVRPEGGHACGRPPISAVAPRHAGSSSSPRMGPNRVLRATPEAAIDGSAELDLARVGAVARRLHGRQGPDAYRTSTGQRLRQPAPRPVQQHAPESRQPGRQPGPAAPGVGGPMEEHDRIARRSPPPPAP